MVSDYFFNCFLSSLSLNSKHKTIIFCALRLHAYVEDDLSVYLFGYNEKIVNFAHINVDLATY